MAKISEADSSNLSVRERVIDFRKKRGFTQESIAKAIGCSRTKYAYHEKRGSFPNVLLIKIADVLDVSIDDILKPVFEPIVPKKPPILKDPAPKQPFHIEVDNFVLTNKEKEYLKKFRSLANGEKQLLKNLIDVLIGKKEM